MIYKLRTHFSKTNQDISSTGESWPDTSWIKVYAEQMPQNIVRQAADLELDTNNSSSDIWWIYSTTFPHLVNLFWRSFLVATSYIFVRYTSAFKCHLLRCFPRIIHSLHIALLLLWFGTFSHIHWSGIITLRQSYTCLSVCEASWRTWTNKT